MTTAAFPGIISLRVSDKFFQKLTKTMLKIKMLAKIQV